MHPDNPSQCHVKLHVLYLYLSNIAESVKQAGGLFYLTPETAILSPYALCFKPTPMQTIVTSNTGMVLHGNTLKLNFDTKIINEKPCGQPY